MPTGDDASETIATQTQTNTPLEVPDPVAETKFDKVDTEPSTDDVDEFLSEETAVKLVTETDWILKTSLFTLNF